MLLYYTQTLIWFKKYEHQEDLHGSPVTQGMQGGSSACSLGVIFSKHSAWNTWWQGRTATTGGIRGWDSGPSGVNATSLLHNQHCSPLGWRDGIDSSNGSETGDGVESESVDDDVESKSRISVSKRIRMLFQTQIRTALHETNQLNNSTA